MAELLDVNIICYTKNDNEFKLQAVYFGSKEKLNIIPLRFVNNNHFEILYPKNFVMPLKIISFDTKDLKLKKDSLTNENASDKNNIKNIPSFFNNKYVDYIYTNSNKYNEIYDFLKNKTYPPKLENIKNSKKRAKKKAKFRNQSKLFKIENNRLYKKNN